MSTEPTAAMVETTIDGLIEWTDEVAPQLFNLSARACKGRNLLLWFAKDRKIIATAMRRAASGDAVHGAATFCPRERRPVPVAFDVVFKTEDAGQHLQWRFSWW